MSDKTNIVLTETGLLTLAGIVVAFLLKCCSQIEQSRCSNINCWGISCDRDVLSEKYLEKLKIELEESSKETKNDNNV